ncbi:VTC domain-containing protein [Catenuloplanes atrovinosus]|uniref:VTC domain-containing protein n=1 Tax=Catenuloplanes atrovinosus TaxID=137266 RepID=A0AAE3YQ43_9ACTN|nr:VTC domain-containing protein [Catenuloplanes atrovinosus]MDR7276279.1 hypothetical protein [Catenuloplanes atrovinosus]
MRPITLDELVARAALLHRVDRKYVVPAADLATFLDRLADDTRILEIDGRHTFRYRSDYLDTPTLTSYLGAAYRRRHRFKIRFRRYEESGARYLEVKTRGRRGDTVKQRIPHPAPNLTPDGLAYITSILTTSGTAGTGAAGAGIAGAGVTGAGVTGIGVTRAGVPATDIDAASVAGACVAGACVAGACVAGVGAGTAGVAGAGFAGAGVAAPCVAEGAAGAGSATVGVAGACVAGASAGTAGVAGTGFAGAGMAAHGGAEDGAARACVAGAGIASGGIAAAGIDLRHALTTRYRRTTFFLPRSASRVTVDEELSWELPDGTTRHVPDRFVIETKSPGGASEADRLLWSLGHRPCPVSKYATGMAALHPTLPANRWLAVLRRLTPDLTSRCGTLASHETRFPPQSSRRAGISLPADASRRAGTSPWVRRPSPVDAPCRDEEPRRVRAARPINASRRDGTSLPINVPR